MLCKKCNIVKTKEDFYESDKSSCKECVKIRVRRNREKVKDGYDKVYKGVVRVLYKTMKRHQKSDFYVELYEKYKHLCR